MTAGGKGPPPTSSATVDRVGRQPALGWRFGSTFWVANVAELFERAAYYGMAIALALYLTNQIGFTDVSAAYVAGTFTCVMYLLPTFSGILADRMGFRAALILAFGLATAGYALLGVAGLTVHGPSADGGSALAAAGADVLLFSEVPRKLLVFVALAAVMFGGSIIKPVISGTVAKSSDEAHRARAFSIFYAMINIGSFTGKSFAAPLRIQLGLEYVNFYAAAMAACALVLVWVAYRNVDTAGTGKTLRGAWEGLVRVVLNFRFMVLIVIVAGFWTIQHQLYASMPKYIIRLLGEQAKPEWLANINPAVVVLLVMPITHLVRRMQAVNAIAIALGLITVSALVVSLSGVLQQAFGTSITVAGIAFHPVTLMVIVGIALQGVGECFLSPKFLEFASKQAPPGEVGLYMGYSHLPSALAYLSGFIGSGYLLDWYCPDPARLPEAVQRAHQLAIAGQGPMPAEYANAHYIWYAFAAVGFGAFLALLLFKYVTGWLDRRAAFRPVS